MFAWSIIFKLAKKNKTGTLSLQPWGGLRKEHFEGLVCSSLFLLRGFFFGLLHSHFWVVFGRDLPPPPISRSPPQEQGWNRRTQKNRKRHTFCCRAENAGIHQFLTRLGCPAHSGGRGRAHLRRPGSGRTHPQSPQQWR